MFARLRCLIRSHHRPARHPLGGFQCADCRTVGADLEEMGFKGMGYVTPSRRIFSRDRAEPGRVSQWDAPQG